MPRIIFEAVLDSSGAVTGLKKLEGELETLGTSTGKTATELRASQRELKRLMDHLEPVRVATEKYTRQQDLLKKAAAEGAISQHQLTAGLAKLKTEYEFTMQGGNKFTSGLRTMGAELGQQVAIYASVALAARAMWNAIKEGMAGFAEEERAMNLLRQTVTSYGGDAEEAARQTRELADSVRNRGLFDDSEVIKTVREMTNLTGDFAQAMSATTLAIDIAAKTGQDLASVQSMLGDVMSGNVRTMKSALKQFEINNAEIKTGAQLIEALEEKYRGASDTIEDTQSQLNKLTFAFGEAKEMLASGLAPAIDVVLDGFKAIVAAGITVVATLKTIITWVAGTVAAIIEGFSTVDWQALISGNFKDFARSAETGKKALIGVMDDTAQATTDIWDKAWQQIDDIYAKGAKTAGDTYEKIIVTAVDNGTEAVNKHNKAAKQFNETMAAQAKLVEDAYVKARKLKGEREALATLEERFAKDVTSSLRDMSRSLTEYSNAQVDANVELRTWLALLEQQGMVRPREGFFPDPADYFGGIKETANEFGDLFAESFADAFIGFMQGDDFGDLWTGLWEALAGGASAKLGKAFDALFSGADWKEAMEAGGLFNPKGEGLQERWGGAIGAGGALLGAYNMRRKEPSPWVGALSGAMAGLATGSVIGMIIGAVAGYFMTPSTSKHGYSYGFRGTEGYVGEVSGGVSKQQEEELERTMTAVYRTTAFAFRDILKQLGVAPGALKEVTVPTVSGKATDPVQVLMQFIKGELPRKVFEVYRDTLTTALTQFKVGDKFAVSAAKAEEMMQNFTDLPFDQALKALQDYTAALVALDELNEDLSKSLEQLEAEVGATMRDTWLRSVDETLEGIRDLSEGLDELTTEEQVARANQIAALTRQQYEQNLQYLNQLISMGRQVNESFAGMFAGWEETKASEGGPAKLMQWYEQQVYQWQQALADAATPEEAQQAMAMLQKYFDAMWRLGPEVPTFGESWRDWVESQSQASLEVFNQLMDQWREEVAQRNQDLLDALDAITAALTGQGELQTGLNDLIDKESDLRDELNGLLDREREARLALIDTLEPGEPGAGIQSASMQATSTGLSAQSLADAAALSVAESEARQRLIAALEAETAGLQTRIAMIEALDAEARAREQSVQSMYDSAAASQAAGEAAYYLAQAAGEAGNALAGVQAGAASGLSKTVVARRSA